MDQFLPPAGDSLITGAYGINAWLNGDALPSVHPAIQIAMGIDASPFLDDMQSKIENFFNNR